MKRRKLMVTLEDVKNNPEVQELVIGAQKQLDALGYTEHSQRHVSIVSNRAGKILETLGYDEHRVELAKIAGYLHDIGNGVNRVDHAHSGAILAYNILKDMGMDVKDRTEIMSAIGNHDETTGTAVSDISAALILADKSDVHRDRVVNKNLTRFEIHDRVNYAVTEANLKIDKEDRKVILDLTIDTKICPVLDYFEIFMDRTMMSKYAAKYLNIWFELIINNTRLL
jgi:metal-dependent HD superfamily phosphatase/phosphodiesterase